MAVEITKRGITKAEKHFIGACSNCKTEIKCLGSDLMSYSGDQRNPGYDYVKCPVCISQITNLKEVSPKNLSTDPRANWYYEGR